MALRDLLTTATPGPWQVEGARHAGDLKIGYHTRLHMVGPDGDAVAAVFFDMKTGRGFMDARLIALAPQLAAALIKAEDALTSIAANTCCDGCQEAALVARAALDEIARLTGGHDDRP